MSKIEVEVEFEVEMEPHELCVESVKNKLIYEPRIIIWINCNFAFVSGA